ncbi:MAG TPA: hypothetical protein VMB50_00280 [Myxococcales bacterium]|nr:hypothetical protein [Myxococcales bacterium]
MRIGMSRAAGFWAVLALAGPGLVACNCNKGTPVAPTIAFTFPSDGATLHSSDNQNPNAAAGTISVTATLTAQNASQGSPVTLTVDGTAGPTATVGSGGAVSIAGVILTGSAQGVSHTLQASVTDSGGNGSASATVHVTVVLAAGTCTVTITPPDGTIFNETGATVGGKTTIKDENTTKAGMQAKITASTTCADGLTATLTAASQQLATGTVSGGQVVFDEVTLPDTSVTALSQASQRLQVTVSIGTASSGASATVGYIVDSSTPTCTITVPVTGKTFTDASDIDPPVPGIQASVSGTSTGFSAQIAAGVAASMSIVNGSGTAYASPSGGQIQADGSFSIEITLLDGSDALVATATTATGNVCTSSTTTVNVNGTPTLSFTQPTPCQVLNLNDDENLATAGLQYDLHFASSAANGSTITVCSSVQPTSGAATCPFQAGAYVVGTVQAGGANTIYSGATLADGDQTLYAQVTDSGGTATATPVFVRVHIARPVVTGIAFSNDYVDPDGGLWLNAADLVDGGAATTVTVMLDPSDDFSLADGGACGGAQTTSLALINLGNGGPVGGGSVTTDGGVPQAVFPLSLPDQAYALEARVSDVWGNANFPPISSPQADQTLIVKTSLPSCTITGPAGAYWNVADNGGATSGPVSLPVTLATANATASTTTGTTIPGSLSIGLSGGTLASVPVASSTLEVPVSAPQGPDDVVATITDPAGNPAQSCAPAGGLELTVDTVLPTLTVGACTSATSCDWTPLPDSFQGTTPTYSSTRTVDIPLTTSASDGTMITSSISALLTSGSTVNYAGGSAVVSGGAATIAENLLNGTDTITFTVTDAAGNVATAIVQIVVNAAGCGLAFTTPAANPAYFNASSGTVVSGSPPELQTSIVLQSDCPLSLVTLTKTPSVGNVAQSSQTTNGSGTATFSAVDFNDGETGTLAATIVLGTAPAGPITYYTKLTPPQIVPGSLAPSSTSVAIVANAGNPNAGTTVGGFLDVASLNAYDASANPYANGSFSAQVTNLGPAPTYGSAALHLSFGTATTDPPTQTLTSATQTVTFAPVNLPPQASTGTVTLTVTDGAGNVLTQQWTVKTSAIPPGPPASLAATVTNQRRAIVKLAWNAPGDGAGNPVASYDLRWVPYAPGATSPWGTSITDGTFFGAGASADPTGGIGSLTGAAPGSPQTYALTGLPPFNSWSIALRSVDAAGNRSEPIGVVSANDNTLGSSSTQAWNQVTYIEPNGNFFGEQMVTADFNGDGLADLAISDPQEGSPPGSVWVINGSASPAAIADVTKPTAGLLQLTENSASDWFGYSMTTVGDLTGSGHPGLAIGSPSWSNQQGRVDIYASSGATGLGSTPVLELEGNPAAGAWFGSCVRTIGDIDGDGQPDLFVGAPFSAGGRTAAQGMGYLFYSSSLKKAVSGGGTTIIAATSADVVFTGSTTTQENFGYRFGAVSTGSGNFLLPASGDSIEYGFSSAQVKGAAGSISVSQNTFNLTDGQGLHGGNYASFGSEAIGGVSFTGGSTPDVVISDPTRGGGYLYLYTTTASGVDQTPAATVSLTTANDDLGWALTSADINGDGAPDILAGTNSSSASIYGAFLYLNQGSSPPAGENAWFGPNPSANLQYGTDNYFGYGVTTGFVTDPSNVDVAVSDGYTTAVLFY